MNSDPLIIGSMQRSAALAHDARERSDRIDAMAPESPTIADEENVTADELGAIKPYLAAYRAWRDQADQAEADADEAHAAYAFAHRLGTGRTLDVHGAELMSGVVTLRGAAAVCETAAPVNVTPPINRTARPREAGRPARRSTRSSAASGDSGDSDSDGPGEPPADSAARGSDES